MSWYGGTGGGFESVLLAVIAAQNATRDGERGPHALWRNGKTNSN